MRRSIVAWSFACAVLAAGTVQAEMAAPTTPPAPAPVPDQMPFDIPYGESITIAKAEKAIAVVDPSGELVAFHKMDQTQLASVGISQNKARTAARYRRPSEAFATAMSTPAGAFVATLASPPPTASPGGIPLLEGGKIIGAIGCSGATGAQDAVACKAGAELFK